MSRPWGVAIGLVGSKAWDSGDAEVGRPSQPVTLATVSQNHFSWLCLNYVDNICNVHDVSTMRLYELPWRGAASDGTAQCSLAPPRSLRKAATTLLWHRAALP
jgi:hypothetical protein